MINLLFFFLVPIGFIVYAIIRWKTSTSVANRQGKSVEKEKVKESKDEKGMFDIVNPPPPPIEARGEATSVCYRGVVLRMIGG